MNPEIIINCIKSIKNSEEDKFQTLSVLTNKLEKIKWLNIYLILSEFSDEYKLKVMDLLKSKFVDQIDVDDLKNILESFDGDEFRIEGLEKLSEYIPKVSVNILNVIVLTLESSLFEPKILELLIPRLNDLSEELLIELCEFANESYHCDGVLESVFNKIDKISEEFFVKLIGLIRRERHVIEIVKSLSKKFKFSEKMVLGVNKSLSYSDTRLAALKEIVNSIDKLSTECLSEILYFGDKTSGEHSDKTKLEIIKLLKFKCVLENINVLNMICRFELFEHKLEIIEVFRPIISKYILYDFLKKFKSDELRVRFVEDNKFESIDDKEIFVKVIEKIFDDCVMLQKVCVKLNIRKQFQSVNVSVLSNLNVSGNSKISIGNISTGGYETIHDPNMRTIKIDITNGKKITTVQNVKTGQIKTITEVDHDNYWS